MPFNPAKSRVSLFGGRSLVLGEDSADEELYIYGNRSYFIELDLGVPLKYSVKTYCIVQVPF